MTTLATKSIRWVLAISTSLVLAACGGGGGDAGTSPFPPPGGGTCSASAAASSAAGACATAIDVVASATQVGSGGDTVTVSAVVKGTGNVGLASTPVTFSASTGNLTSPSATTDATGTAKVTFSAGSNSTNRTATVTVRSGSASGKIDIEIAGSKLVYSGVTTVPLGGTVSIGVKATDSKGNPLPNVTVGVTSSLNNGLSATSVSTDAQGVATVSYTATNSGTDKLTFTGAGITLAQSVLISASDFAFVSPAAGATVTVGTAQSVTVRYRVNNAAQVGQAVNFSTTAGTVSPATVTTDGSGQATVSVSSTTSGPATLQATVSGGSAQATLPITFVSQAPAKVVVQVSPTAIGPNDAGSTTQQAQIRAFVSDANGNPVANTIVSFTRVTDPSGGTLSQPSSVTDTSGIATVQFIAGPLTTADKGVEIRAGVLGTSVVSSPDAFLTVNRTALFIALGTGNVITNLDPQTYKKDYVVYVTDANGVAVANKDITIKVLPVEYRKGNLVFNTVWTYGPSVVTCANEDANYNGILDPGEDFNNSGTLQPGNVIAVTTAQTTTAAASGIARTDSTGRATISLIYAESYVPWVKVRLVAQATVAGTESSTETQFYVPGLADDFSSATNPPAGVTSPFGTGSCSSPN